MMPFIHLLAAASLVVALGATPALADWVVAQATQRAVYTVDGRLWRPLSVGMAVPNQAWIHTGRSGRLLLRYANDLIQFKPNSVGSLAWRSDPGTETTIFQKFGTILIDVEPRPNRRFSVETPFLAALVKGTRFEVEVHRTRAEVRVHKGVVRVTHRVLGLAADAHGGHSAIAHGDRHFSVRGGQVAAEILPVEPSRALVGAPRAAGAGRSFPVQPEDNDEAGNLRRNRELREHQRAVAEARQQERRRDEDEDGDDEDDDDEDDDDEDDDDEDDDDEDDDNDNDNDDGEDDDGDNTPENALE